MTRAKLPGFPYSQQDWTLLYCKAWAGKVTIQPGKICISITNNAQHSLHADPTKPHFTLTLSKRSLLCYGKVFRSTVQPKNLCFRVPIFPSEPEAGGAFDTGQCISTQ